MWTKTIQSRDKRLNAPALEPGVKLKFSVQPMSQQDVDEIVTWRYDSPYDIYNLSREDRPVLLDPDNRYFVVKDESGRKRKHVDKPPMV